MIAISHLSVFKLPWGKIGASPPQVFSRESDRPHRPHGVGAYAAAAANGGNGVWQDDVTWK